MQSRAEVEAAAAEAGIMLPLRKATGAPSRAWLTAADHAIATLQQQGQAVPDGSLEASGTAAEAADAAASGVTAAGAPAPGSLPDGQGPSALQRRLAARQSGSAGVPDAEQFAEQQELLPANRGRGRGGAFSTRSRRWGRSRLYEATRRSTARQGARALVSLLPV